MKNLTSQKCAVENIDAVKSELYFKSINCLSYGTEQKILH